ncbi:unnamed protein product, partial [marine sediment metagenome]
ERGRAFLRRYLDMGVDLVCISGTKAIDGPTDTGVIYGKKELVEAAALQGAPGKAEFKGYIDRGIELKASFLETALSGHNQIGRGFKVSREQDIY